MRKYLFIILILNLLICESAFSQRDANSNDNITFANYKYFVFWVRDSVLRAELGKHFEDYWKDIDSKKFVVNWNSKINLADDEVFYYLKDSDLLIYKNNECFFNSKKLIYKENITDSDKINVYPDFTQNVDSNFKKELVFDKKWNQEFDSVRLRYLSVKQLDAYRRWSLNIEQRKIELNSSVIKNCKNK